MKCDNCKEVIPRMYLIYGNGYWLCLKCSTTIPKVRGVINHNSNERLNKKTVIITKVRR